MPAPSTAKKPQDHQPKAEAPKDRVVTVDDQEWTVPAEALDDFELLDDLGALEDGNAARLPAVMRRLLGEDYKRALNHLRGEDGRVRIEPASEFIAAIMQGLDPNS